MTLQELNQHLDLLEQLSEAEEMLDALRAAACPRAQNLSGMPHAPGVRDKVGDLAVEIADMSGSVESLRSEVRESEAHILPYITDIRDNQTRLVFRLRFLRGLTWKEVARVIGGRNSEDSVKMVCYRYLDE